MIRAIEFTERIIATFGEPRFEGHDVWSIGLVFEKPIPNADGTLEIASDKKQPVSFRLVAVTKNAKGEDLDTGKPTDRLEFHWNSHILKKGAKSLIGKMADIKLDPAMVSTEHADFWKRDE